MKVVDEPILLPPVLEDIELPPNHLSPSDLERLQEIVPSGCLSASKQERLSHTYGKSYHDLIRVRRKIFPEVPDAVVYPMDEMEIRGVLTWAGENRITLVPWGGGTSVTGGVEAIRGNGHRGLVVMDMRRMDKVLAIHKTSLLADVQAGISGPKLEDELQTEGFTLSHYLESFEYSTLGGWIATRSAGQQSTRYGKIEDMIESVRVLTPTGLLQTPDLPAAANGPDLAQLMIGSEGIFGIITQARVRIRRLPQKKIYTGALFRSFEDGVEAMRRILQAGVRPATLRLSDAEETEFVFSLRKKKRSPIANALDEAGLWWLQKRGFRPQHRSILIWGVEGSRRRVQREWRDVKGILNCFPVCHLGQGVGRDWYRHRFENPYLRDVLLNYDIMVDTLETATEWDNILNLWEKVRKAVTRAYGQLKISGVITAHLSHMYVTGCSLYFVLLATPHVAHEVEEWWTVKRAASNAIVAEGGAISHHHGIGLDHRTWLVHNIGEEGLRLLWTVKQKLDPQTILNPRKLLPDVDCESWSVDVEDVR